MSRRRTRKNRKKKERQERSTLTVLGQHRKALAVSTLLVVAVLVLIVVARGGGSSPAGSGNSFLSGLSPDVRELYQYAVDRPDVLAYIPCYCGCENLGHKSVLDCFIAGHDEGGPVFETHAYSCGVCRSIAREAKKMVGKGVALSQVRAAIDKDFGYLGSGTNTPLPPSG